MKIKKKVMMVCIAFVIAILLTACGEDILVGRWEYVKSYPVPGPPQAAAGYSVVIEGEVTRRREFVFFNNSTGMNVIFVYVDLSLFGSPDEMHFEWSRKNGNLTITYLYPLAGGGTLSYDISDAYLTLSTQPLISAFTNRPVTPPLTMVFRRITDEAD